MPAGHPRAAFNAPCWVRIVGIRTINHCLIRLQVER
jgi:hypothetical protein